MPSMTKLILIDRRDSFVSTLIWNLIGRKGDGSNFGLERIQILLDIESLERKKTKGITLGI